MGTVLATFAELEFVCDPVGDVDEHDQFAEFFVGAAQRAVVPADDGDDIKAEVPAFGQPGAGFVMAHADDAAFLFAGVDVAGAGIFEG